MVLELAVVLCPMEAVDFFQGVPNELWFQVVRIIYYPSMFSLYSGRVQFHTQLVYTAYLTTKVKEVLVTFGRVLVPQRLIDQSVYQEILLLRLMTLEGRF